MADLATAADMLQTELSAVQKQIRADADRLDEYKLQRAEAENPAQAERLLAEEQDIRLAMLQRAAQEARLLRLLEQPHLPSPSGVQ